MFLFVTFIETPQAQLSIEQFEEVLFILSMNTVARLRVGLETLGLDML